MFSDMYLGDVVQRLDKASTAYGMEISAKKTKLMKINTSGINKEITVNGQKFQTITSFNTWAQSYLTRVPSQRYSPG